MDTKQQNRIKRANARFNKLTKAQKRVAIARDVLKQLDNKRIKATSGIYFKGTARLPEISLETEVQNIIEKTPQCNACALGSMFVCAVNAANRLKVKDLYARSLSPMLVSFSYADIDKYLSRFFSNRQLSMIESAFECSYMRDFEDVFYDNDWAADKERELAQRCIAFGRTERSDRKRMVKIMKNIIKNNGEFVP